MNILNYSLLTLTVFSLSAHSTNRTTTSKAKYFVCWENHVDAIVTLGNGDLWALKAGWAWKLTLDTERDLLALASERQFQVEQLWEKLPADFDFVFTMPRLDSYHASTFEAIPGKTIFVKVPHYYVYENFNFTSSDKMIHWDTLHFIDVRFVFTMHKTALVLITKLGIIPDILRRTIGGNIFMFDGAHFPERVGFFEISIKGVPWLQMKQMIPIETPESNLYLVILNYGFKGTYYCLFRVTVSKSWCHMKEIANAFSCPEQLIDFKRSNWAQTLFRLSGCTVLQVIVFLSGALLAGIWVLLILMANSLHNFSTFYGCNLRLLSSTRKEW